MIRLLTWVSILCVMVMGYATVHLWKTGRQPWEAPPPPKTTEQIVKEEDGRDRGAQVEFLTFIIRHSFRSDKKELLLVALAAKNTAVLVKKNYEWVFRNAGEQVPPWSTKSTYVRWKWVVDNLASKGEHAAARSLAEQIVSGKFMEPYRSLFEQLKPEERCVTTFYRPDGAKNPQNAADLDVMKAWKPKVYQSTDGAFWLCLPLKRPEKS